MNELISLLTGLGPTGLLAGATVIVWLEYQKARSALDAERAARLVDARETTTQMLALAERVHQMLDTLESVRASRHD